MSVEISFVSFGRFMDQDLQKEFIVFCMKQRSNLSYVALTVMILGWAIAETVASTWFNDADGDFYISREEETYGILSLVFSILSLILCLCLCFLSTFNSCSFLPFIQDPMVYSYLQVLFLITMNLVFIVKIIKQINVGVSHCLVEEEVEFISDLEDLIDNILQNNPSELDSIKSYLNSLDLPAPCPSHDSFYSIISYSMVLVMSFCPQLLMAIIYEPRLYLILFFHLISGVLILYSMYSSIYSILPVLITFIIIAVLLIELHFQRLQGFLNQRKIQQLLEENERNADETHATEMRHMIGNVAHDLKTPLASFTNGLDLIKDVLQSAYEIASDKGMTPEKFNDCFSTIQTCIRNIRNTNAFMLMTINRCIDYTKASKGMKLVPKYETVDLKETLQFPIECMSNIQERIGIKLQPMSDEICSHIITDKQWLQENLLCLLSNAVKYSAEGDVTIASYLVTNLWNDGKDKIKELSTSLALKNPDEMFLIFELEDNGIGVSEEAMKSLFNPFKQAQRLAGGTGLGLYSLAKRIEALRGSYGVRRRRDGKQGSLFWFAIPYKPDMVSSATSKDMPPGKSPRSTVTVNEVVISEAPNTCEKTYKLEILIVDDTPSILKMSSMMLKRQGHQIWTAENGEIALKRIEEKFKETGKGFDLVLMDLQMPVMDGLEATRRLRAMEAEGRDWIPRLGENCNSSYMTRTSTSLSHNTSLSEEKENEVPPTKPFHQVVVGVSANSDVDTMNEAFTAGVDDFFGKPFTLETFKKTVERFCHMP